MAKLRFFRSKDELERLVASLARLLEGWGLAPNDWMLGKNPSLHFSGALRRASQVSRDVTVHVIRTSLPWKVEKGARTVLPPVRSRYAKQYFALQQEFQCGIDFWPTPDLYSNVSDIRQASYHTIAGHQVNVETLAKYLKRRLKVSQALLRQPAEQVREFYYANEQRYRQRLLEMERFQRFVRQHDRRLLPQIKALIRYYEQNMRRAYPELFARQPAAAGDGVIKGQVIAAGQQRIVGQAYLARSGRMPPPGKVLIFSHLWPADTNLVRGARAVVTDGGGLLSHAAVVCREFKVPGIVGTRNATQLLKTGDRVELDLRTGTVRRLGR